MKRTSLFVIALFLASLASADGFARDGGRRDDDQDVARRAVQRGEILPIIQILPLVAQHLPGDVIEVNLDRRKGRLCYEIKVLTPAGKVRELLLDARDGAFVDIED